MKNIIRVCGLCLLFYGCTSSPLHHKIKPTEVNKFLSNLPKEERLALEYFFGTLIREDPVGYVLLGEKPMSIHDYYKPKIAVRLFSTDPLADFDFFFEGLHPNDSLFHRGMETWKKYETRFCGKKYFFRSH